MIMDVNVKSKEILKNILPKLIDDEDCEWLLLNQLKSYSNGDKLVLEKNLRKYLFDHNYLSYVELTEYKCKFEYCNDSLWIQADRKYDYYVSDDSSGIIVDFDINGNVVAFEILSASQIFKLTEKQLDDLSNVIVNINVNEDVIKFNLILIVDDVKNCINGRILNEYGSKEGVHIFMSKY